MVISSINPFFCQKQKCKTVNYLPVAQKVKKRISMVSKERDEIIALEAAEEYLNNINWINDEIRATLSYVIEVTICVPKKHESEMFKNVMALSRHQEVEAASLFGLITDAIMASENAIQKRNTV